MDRVESAPESGPVVGVLGAESPAIDELAAAVAAVDGHLATGTADDVVERDPTVVIAVGDGAFASVARCEEPPPVLPVSQQKDTVSTSLERASALLAAALGGEKANERQWAEVAYPTLDVSVGEATVARAAFDVALVTDESATISEYAVRTTSEELGCFRADGVVVATAAGSEGYAGAAGGPVVPTGVDALSVVPVAPFLTERTQWVVSVDALAISIERDEAAVSLQVDGRVIETVSGGTTVSIDPGPTVPVWLIGEEKSKT